MARSKPLPPSAASLTASLRDLGYSFETAVADIVDNSISADATDIQIFCDLSWDNPVLVIADNGKGMGEDDVVAAMRHGSTDPRKVRGPRDLGRFGLGLKTASFSQCRRLTVASAKSGTMAAAEWNLQKIEDVDDWVIDILEPDEIAALPYIEALTKNGTLVVWRDLDRLFEDETGKKRDEIVSDKLAVVTRHLALVFHRFLAGDIKGRKRLKIGVNGHPVEPFDPFCRKNTATQMLPEETVWIGDTPITMQPYVLPHHSRLSQAEFDFYQSRSDFISNQGAYVYRNGRLMAWGDWFRLVPKGEATKLARVQIDFPNSLDEAWTIDIKKSRARPPYPVRERLRQIVTKITDRSVRVHRGRGQKFFQEQSAPIWERYADHSGIRFEVNLEHPLIAALHAKLGKDDSKTLEMILQSIAASIPVEMIYSDYSTNPRDVVHVEASSDQILEKLLDLKQVVFGDSKFDPDMFRDVINSTRLFDNQLEAVEKFISDASD